MADASLNEIASVVYARQKCALISEGICPDCKGQLERGGLSAPRWAICLRCGVAHRASGSGGGNDFEWQSRLIDHESLGPLGEDGW